MQNDDGTPTKNQEKERVLAAITALKAQGADINPYTVSGEAQVPRSTLYRDPELMDLIHRERNGEAHNLSNDEAASKMAELEEANQALNEQIWDLEKQLESMTKAKQDAYVQGFQAGIEEAAKRYAAASGEGGAPARAEAEQRFEAGETGDIIPQYVAQTAPATVAFEPIPEIAYEPGIEKSYQMTPEMAYAQNDTPPNGGRRPIDTELGENTGDFEPLGAAYDFGRSPKDSHIAEEFRFNGGSLTAEEPDLSSFATEPLTTAAPQANAQFEEHDILDEIESVLSDPAPAPTPTQAKAKAPDIDFSLANEQPQEAFRKPKKNAFPDIDFGLSSENDQPEPEPAYETSGAGAQTHAYDSAEAELQPALSEVARDPDAIYNIARSGPTISTSAYNPLVELSWKDLQTVYNFSVASLKDYAKPGFGTEPGPLSGTNFADKTTQQPSASASAASAAARPNGNVLNQHPNRTADRLPSTSALPPQYAQEDQQQTGDRLQAMSDPRNLFDSEPIVDLDALDIFDDLDDYVDLDKIEIINDIVTKPGIADEPTMGGDELRELIKGRIRQASEIAHEPAAPRMTTPPVHPSSKDKDDESGKDGGKAGAGGGARNKFVGGAKAGQEPPAAASSFVVKSIPPEIRKACMILGIKPEEATQKLVIQAWKNQIASPGVHPDLGGDTEAAVFLNTAKDTLVRWLDAQAPKLGKKFGQPPKDQPPKDQPK